MITLICSTYNSNEWIDGYLESVNNQTFPYFNIHFIDAGSTDGSWLKINNFKFRVGISVKYTLEPGCSVYEAWNIGYQKAETPYCMNYNTDDRLFPTALTAMWEHAKANKDVDVLYSSCFVVSDPTHKDIVGYHNWPEFSKDTLLSNCMIGPFPLVKTKSIEKFNPEFTISGDYEMWLRMESKGRKFKKIEEPIGKYYNNPKGISSNSETFKEHVIQDTKLREMYK